MECWIWELKSNRMIIVCILSCCQVELLGKALGSSKITDDFSTAKTKLLLLKIYSPASHGTWDYVSKRRTRSNMWCLKWCGMPSKCFSCKTDLREEKERMKMNNPPASLCCHDALERKLRTETSQEQFSFCIDKIPHTHTKRNGVCLRIKGVIFNETHN